jgi:hypothetical protein
LEGHWEVTKRRKDSSFSEEKEAKRLFWMAPGLDAVHWGPACFINKRCNGGGKDLDFFASLAMTGIWLGKVYWK